jgi:hypothetical protein
VLFAGIAVVLAVLVPLAPLILVALLVWLLMKLASPTVTPI